MRKLKFLLCNWFPHKWKVMRLTDEKVWWKCQRCSELSVLPIDKDRTYIV